MSRHSVFYSWVGHLCAVKASYIPLPEGPELYCKVLPWRSVLWWPSLCSPWGQAHRPLLFKCRNTSSVFRALEEESGQSHRERMDLHGTSKDWGPGELATGALFPWRVEIGRGSLSWNLYSPFQFSILCLPPPPTHTPAVKSTNRKIPCFHKGCDLSMQETACLTGEQTGSVLWEISWKEWEMKKKLGAGEMRPFKKRGKIWSRLNWVTLKLAKSCFLSPLLLASWNMKVLDGRHFPTHTTSWES